MLYKRVKELAKKKEGTDSALAEKLGLARQTFQGYLNEKRQHNLLVLLPRMLELYPDVSRDWLYFGEGHPFEKGGNLSGEDTRVHALEQENAELKAKLASSEVGELRGRLADLEATVRQLEATVRQLETRLIIDGVGDKSDAAGIVRAAGGQK